MSSDKAYSAELWLNQLWNHLGPAPAGGGNGQRQTIRITATQTISSTSQVHVGANSVPLSWTITNTGLYLLEGNITYIPNAAAGSAILRVAGVTASNVRIKCKNYPGTGVQSANVLDVTTINGDITSSTMGAGSPVCEFQLAAVLSLSGIGTLSVDARCSIGTDTFDIQSYSWATLESVGQTS